MTKMCETLMDGTNRCIVEVTNSDDDDDGLTYQFIRIDCVWCWIF